MNAVLDEVLRLSEPFEWGELQGAGRRGRPELPLMVHSLITQPDQREAGAIAGKIEQQCLTDGFGATDACAPVIHLLAVTLELATTQSHDGVFDLLLLFLGQDRSPKMGTLDAASHEALVPWFDTFESHTESVPMHEYAAFSFELMIACAKVEAGFRPRVQPAQDRLLEAFDSSRKRERDWIAVCWRNFAQLPRS